MSITIEIERLSELSSKIADLRKLSTKDAKIAALASMESAGGLIAFSLLRGDSQSLALLASSGAMVTGLTALFTAIIRQNKMEGLQWEKYDRKMEEQEEKIDQLVDELPEETFSIIWNSIKQFREEATFEQEQIGPDILPGEPTANVILQALSKRAGEPEEQFE